MREPDDFDVSGLRVLVTGSSRGVGEGVAEYLASQGASIALHGRDMKRLEAVRSRLSAKGATAIVVTGDARMADEVKEFVEAAASALGGLDGLINNAGGTFAAAATDMSPNAFASVVNANLTTAFSVAQAAFPFLEKTKGCVINISSVSALRPSPEFSHYAAAKAGLISLTKSLAAEWGPRGVRVNAILPGLLGTESALGSLFRNDPERIKQAAEKIGVGRLGTPEDVAMACRYLLSRGGSFVNGEALVVDGGPSNEQRF
ncbi:MAG: SDR family NAD(P)-dependent oxidoreductase [Actinomycetota bacterium]|nr:SDR family oxidoreductase [Actinomycetota bacterium]